MSLFGALNTAVGSIGALNTGIRTISDNISNSTNENYNSRRTQFVGNEFGGVNVGGIIRAANDSLQRDLLSAEQEASANGTLNRLYEQLEQLTGTIAGQTALSNAVEDLRTAFKAFEAAPESNAAEADVVNSGEAIVRELERLSTGLDELAAFVEADVVSLVTELNAALTEVDRLNDKIVGEQVASRDSSVLENLRDKELERISQIMEIKTFERADGALIVYTSTGLDLSADRASSFTYNTSTNALTKSGHPSTDLTIDGNLPDGELQSLLNFIRTDFTATSSNTNGLGTLEKVRNQLDEFAFDLVDDATIQTVGTVAFDPGAAAGLAGTLTIDVGAGAQPVAVVATDTPQQIVDRFNLIANVRARLTAFDTIEVSTVAGTTMVIDDVGSVASSLGLVTSDPQTFTALDPPTLSTAYNGAGTSAAAALTEATNFFEVETGTTPTDVTRINLRVNDTLSAGTESLKQLSGNAVVAALNGGNRSLFGSGLIVSNTDYTGLASGILTDVSKQAQGVTILKEQSETLRDNIRQAIRDEVGVDIDEEIARLTVFQNSFAATSRVIDAVNTMLEQLENAAR